MAAPDLSKERIAQLLSEELEPAVEIVQELAPFLAECEDVMCGEPECEASRNADDWLADHEIGEGS